MENILKISPPLAVFVAQQSGQQELAQERFEKIFTDAELTVPEGCWDENQLTIHSICCDPEEVGTVKDGPLVSVVLTAHNEEAYLSTALQSLLKQSWQSQEIIVVDDGSTDNTFGVALDFQKRDARIRAYRLGENVGIWAAKNFGITKSTGDFITMHDADDWSHPAKISAQIKPLMTNRTIACSSSYFLRINEETGQLFSRNAENFLRWNPSSLLFRKQLVDEVGLFQTSGLGKDCEFVARIENRFSCKKHARIRKPLSLGLWRKNGLSNKLRDGEKAMDRLEQWETWRREHLNFHSNSKNIYSTFLSL
ncbi:glycosyltransferase family 2 protein [Sneathiella marina]|uniref:Glycosyltransferase family 2 protein n=1 Tax=Sneathiella marina TaxID=2950108 RepID=A0ABY4W6L1_9PROT|nr:glycosyltransferase family A protein [Sneathiella marina]USG62805.1 glycosyltransferase family 2 protein [Sneathiella marina]